jgi:transcriptional regulator with XRE-family HTH domain
MPSVSQILRQTREAKGISLDEVAQRTYIKLPYLVALEEGDVSKLPAPVYIHGYIRQYAKLMGLNGSELVLQYQQDQTPPLAPKLTVSTASNYLAEIARDESARPERRYETLQPIESSLYEDAYTEQTVPQAEPLVTQSSLPPRSMIELAPALESGLPSFLSERVPTLTADPEGEVDRAKQEAQKIVTEAQREAHEMRVSAERYADQVLAQLESEVSRALQTVRNGRAFLQSRRRKHPEA